MALSASAKFNSSTELMSNSPFTHSSVPNFFVIHQPRDTHNFLYHDPRTGVLNLDVKRKKGGGRRSIFLVFTKSLFYWSSEHGVFVKGKVQWSE